MTAPAACAFDGAVPTSTVEAALRSRRSVRAYLPRPVPQAEVRGILDLAARSPSGTNMQPWRAHVLAGEALHRFRKSVAEAHDAGALSGHRRPYYPERFFEPYLGRRRKVGFDLYRLLGIEKGDRDAMHRQHGRNFLFFDAPVGLIFTIDRRLEIGSWLDYGMFLQSVMLAARSKGLATCGQAAFAHHSELIGRLLDCAPHEEIVCGMSLGYEDLAAPENALRTERAGADDFATFRGFARDGTGEGPDAGSGAPGRP